MNVTFLIGNGFDLGLGLKTLYSDYYEKFFNDVQNKESKDLSEAIKKDINNWSDFEKKIGEYTQNFTPETKEEFFTAIDSFEEGLLKYLKTEENKIIYTSEIIVPTLEKALLHFYDTDILSIDDSQHIQDSFDHFNPKSCVLNFINFNYTETLEKCLKVFPGGVSESSKERFSNIVWEIGNVTHVHGTIEQCSIVGVDNVAQIKRSELARDQEFVQKLVKPKINQYIGMQFSKQAKDYINKSQIICVYGMSIGETDATWWQTIDQWLKKDSLHKLILFIHDDFDSSLSRKIVEEKNDAISRILQFSGYTQNINEELAQRIYGAINKDIFSMKLL